MSSTQQIHHRLAAAPAGRGVAMVVNAVRAMVMAIDTIVTRQRARRHLESLDDRMLKDIGLTHADVFVESRKPFWRG
ncbi:MAG: DUF1127 domain-containing protein [Alphaproteobacteria bacterium]